MGSRALLPGGSGGPGSGGRGLLDGSRAGHGLGFRRFVDATGYVTVAERPLTLPTSRGPIPCPRAGDRSCSRKTDGQVDLRDVLQWWDYEPTLADGPRPPGTHWPSTTWRPSPPGRASSCPPRPEEFAARGGLEDADFAWGDSPFPGGRPMANTWRGEPWRAPARRRLRENLPVGAFRPTVTGCSDITGNVWEWTSDFFEGTSPRRRAARHASPATRSRAAIKGGSAPCAPNYCLRHRPAARQVRRLFRPAHRLPLHRALHPERDARPPAACWTRPHGSSRGTGPIDIVVIGYPADAPMTGGPAQLLDSSAAGSPACSTPCSSSTRRTSRLRGLDSTTRASGTSRPSKRSARGPRRGRLGDSPEGIEPGTAAS